MIFYDFSKELIQYQCLESLWSTIHHQKWLFFIISSLWRFRVSRVQSVVPKNIYSMDNINESNRHVTYREKKASYEESNTAPHSILHEHLAMKIRFYIIRSELKKRFASSGTRKCLKYSTDEFQDPYATSQQVTKLVYIVTSQKLSNNQLFRWSKMNQVALPRK